MAKVLNDLESMLDEAEAVVRDMLGKFSQVSPFLLCQPSDGEKFIVSYEAAPTLLESRMVALELGKKLREMRVARFVVVNEVWFSSEAGPGEPLRRPTHTSDRKEAVNLEAHDTTTVKLRMLLIERADNRVELVHHKEMLDVKPEPWGTWDDLLEAPSPATRT